MRPMAIAMDTFSMSTLGDLRWSDMRRRVRGSVGGRTLVDSTRVRQVWEPHRVVGQYALPTDDIAEVLVGGQHIDAVTEPPAILTPEDDFAIHTCPGRVWGIRTAAGELPGAGFTPDDPDLADHVILDWAAFDEWTEEEQVVVGHPHDPFKRIDCLTTSRHVIVTAGGVVLADTTSPTLLLETFLPPRHYVPRADVRLDLLVPSETITTCAYKGNAQYWSAVIGDRVIEDVAWTYTDPLLDALPVRDLICFYDERVDVRVAATSG